MRVGCYTLDLYCDKENTEHVHKEFPHQFTGKTGEECKKQAKKKGWTLRDYIDRCPKCSE